MRINKVTATAVILVGLLAGGLVIGGLFSQQPRPVEAAPPAQQKDDIDAKNDDD